MEVSGRRQAGDEKQATRGNITKCEACKGGLTTKANGLCIECDEFMCNTCFEHHLKAKLCRNHVFDTTFTKSMPVKTSIFQISTDFRVEKCKRHSGEQIKFFCRKHDIVGCGECMIPDHGGCSPVNIQDICKEFRYSEEFAGFERNVESVESLSKENSINIQENRKANAEMYEKALNCIKQFRKDINKFLDNAETAIIREAKKISDANDNRLTKQESDCNRQSSRIAKVSGQMNPDLYSDTDLFIQTVTLKPIISDLQKAVSRLQQENNIKEFSFAPGKQLQSLTNSLQKFGEICCSSPSSIIFRGAKKRQEKTPNTKTEDKMQWSALCDSKDIARCFDAGSRVRAWKEAEYVTQLPVKENKEHCVDVESHFSVFTLDHDPVKDVGTKKKIIIEWDE